ncbi:MAG: hypothetical protein AAFZ15_09590 [Bacteroidota bacterium]
MRSLNFLSLKINRRFFVSLSFLLLLSLSCFSQVEGWNQGYYLSPQSDTVFGVFNFDKVPAKKVRFKNSSDERKIGHLTPQDIQLIQCENGLFYQTTTVKQMNESEEIFVERVLAGPIQLYQGVAKAGKVFFIESDDQEGLISVNRTSPETFFRNYFKDCTLPQKIGFNINSMEQVILAVHDCRSGGRPPLVPAPKEKPVFYVGPRANLYTYRAEITNGLFFFEASDYEARTNIGFGLAAKMELNRRIALNLGLEYQQKEVQSDSIASTFTTAQTIPNDIPGLPPIDALTVYTYRFILRADYAYIRAPFGVEYNFTSHKKSTFSVSFGGAFRYLTSVNTSPNPLRASRLFSENPVDPPIESGDLDIGFIETDNRLYTDFYGGVGFKTKLKARSMLEILVTYNRSSDQFLQGYNIGGELGEVTVTSNFLQASLTYYFRL